MRYDDMIWRLRWHRGGAWVYVYLLIEFQRTDEPFMAVRVLDYEAGLYRQIVRAMRLKRGDPLPIVLPLVLYHAYPAWTSETEVFDLIAPAPPEVEPYLPHLRYLLLDVNTYPADELERMHNPVACIFQLEASKTPVTRPIDQLAELLRPKEHSELRNAATEWLKRVFLPLRFPGVTVPEVKNLEEVSLMIAEHAIDWTAQSREEGRQQGEAAVLLRLLQRKYGSVSPQILERVQHADSDQLLEWADRFVTASTVEEIFNGSGT
jgi:hypothetical protein